MGDYIFRHIYAGKFEQFSKVRQPSKDPRNLGIIHATFDMPDAFFDVWKRTADKLDALFNGRVWLLVDNNTFSSAVGFAAMFRDYGVGKIVGYETGGVPVCFGDTYQFFLNNSGIECGVSCKQFFCSKPRPGDDEHGVLPDVPLCAELLANFRGETDPVLAYTLSYIRQNPRP